MPVALLLEKRIGDVNTAPSLVSHSLQFSNRNVSEHFGLPRAAKLRQSMAIAEAGDGRVHPNRMLATLQEKLDPNAIVVVDGGDFLSFARVGLSASTILDGCDSQMM
jgi:thiamine pyrophosphate-dependent acetolactate synthase large subunit-like protein